jgi:hypothetical protein
MLNQNGQCYLGMYSLLLLTSDFLSLTDSRDECFAFFVSHTRRACLLWLGGTEYHRRKKLTLFIVALASDL